MDACKSAVGNRLANGRQIRHSSSEEEVPEDEKVKRCEVVEVDTTLENAADVSARISAALFTVAI